MMWVLCAIKVFTLQHSIQKIPDAGNCYNAALYLYPVDWRMGIQLYATKQVCLLLISVTMTQASSAAQAPSFDSRFTKLNPGDNLTGKVAAVYTSESLEECVLRYAAETHCLTPTIRTDYVMW